VDSTRLTAQLGDGEMAALWTLHDRTARDLAQRWNGREIDKTDGMLLLFESVADAAGYSAAYHEALRLLPSAPIARAGLHLGDVILRQNGPADIARGAKPLEVEGIAKSVAARVMALAAGGRTLLTATAAQSLRSAGIEVTSHGHWMLKGVPEPIELFEACAGGCAGPRPSDSDKAYQVIFHGGRWLPTSELPNNLPPPLFALMGRDRELNALRTHLETGRLITLTGMGGIGKTQLALQVARGSRVAFPDGAWLVDLQAIRDAVHVVGELAQVLGVREEASKPLLRTMCVHLRSQRALLVLDNCEQIVESCADAVQAILDSAPGVRVICTSREPLGVPGEVQFRVSPLPLPPPDASADAALASPAVQLFIARAANADGEDQEPDRAVQIGRLVARLEGIPLAIELAAARSRSMSVEEITRRLEDQRFAILTHGGRARTGRQQTLRALLDWSYELLNEPECRALESLGVFMGGFDLPAAQAVLGHDDVTTSADLLASLVDKSLLIFDPRTGAGRYRMLETVREYAAARLAASGRLHEAQQSHCACFFALAKSANVAMKGPGLAKSIQQLELEMDNLRAAMALALRAPSQPALAVKFGVAVQKFWLLRGYAREGLAYMKLASELPAVKAMDIALAHALYVSATLAGTQGHVEEALDLLQQSLRLRRAMGNPVDIAASLSTQAHFRLHIGDASGAAAMEQEALDLFTQAGDLFGQCISWQHLALASVFAGRSEEASSQAARCLAIAKEIGNTELEAEAELLLGRACIDSRPHDARTHFARAFAICEASGNTQFLATCAQWLSRLAALEGDASLAVSQLGSAAATFLRFGMQDELLSCVEDAVPVLGRRTGVAMAASAASGRKRLGVVRSPADESRWTAALGKLRGELGSATFDLAWQEGLEWSLERAAQCVADYASAMSPEAARSTSRAEPASSPRQATI
jgi:predicted ATPase/class 3 adenylate cyclase